MGAFGILEAMLLHIGIEVAARGGELRPFALRVLMDVDGMLARGQIFEVERDLDARAFVGDLRDADVFAVGILQRSRSLACRRRKAWRRTGLPAQSDNYFVDHSASFAILAQPITLASRLHYRFPGGTLCI